MIEDHYMYMLYIIIYNVSNVSYIIMYLSILLLLFLQHEYDGVELESRSYTFIAKRYIA